MGKNKLNKSILLGTLVFGQCAGTVVAMQNSIVSAYAEQKNKEVTSQEFLDYINQLKEQNPNFKFNQGETKVFDSEEQALANLAEQKQAINTAISNYKQAVEERNTRYEQEKQSVKQQNEQITQENNQKEQEYQAKLSAYNAKKAEVEQWKLANPVITQLDNGIKLRGNYDESKKNSINYFDNIAIDASKELLETGGYETISKSIKMSPNSTVEVVNASSALIDNTNGHIGGMTLDNYPIKTIKSWRIKAGTPAGELLNMNLRNIGETDSGKTISAHVKFVLDYATSDTPQVSNAEGSINVVKDGLLHMYWLPKSDNSSDKQGGHYEIRFYDDATGQPIKLANTILSIDLDGETEKSTVSSESAKGIIPTLPSDVGTANATGTKYPTIESNTGTSVTYKGKTDFGIDDTETTPYGEGLTLFAGSTLNVSFETNDSRWGGYSVINIPKLGKVDLTLPEEPVQPTPKPPIDEPAEPPIVNYPQVGEIANTITYNRVAVKQVDTRWIDISGKELKTPVTDTSTKPAGDIEHYSFVESRTDDEGNVTHVFRQYTTKWVDESGKELKDMVTDKDTKEHGTIQDYSYVNSETDNNGNVTHIFRQYTTKWVDGDNKELKPLVTGDSVKEHGEIPDYAYVTTNTDERGNVTHVFRQYVTEWVDEEGNSLKDSVKGSSTVEKGNDIKDYKFVESKTDEKGNVKHIFKQFTTKWVTTSLEDLDKPVKTDEFKDSKTFENYQFVETREVGNTRTHIYRPYETTWVEEGTNKELKKDNKLVKEHGEIKSYTFVRTETKDNGDIVHIYKKVEQKTTQKKDDIPTGVHTNGLISMFMILISSIGLALTSITKKREE